MRHSHSSGSTRYVPQESDPPPFEIFKHVFRRQYGHFQPYPKKVTSEYVSRHLPGMLKERQFNLGRINKIFAASWISDKQVVYGTKCNKVGNQSSTYPVFLNLTTLWEFNFLSTPFSVYFPARSIRYDNKRDGTYPISKEYCRHSSCTVPLWHS